MSKYGGLVRMKILKCEMGIEEGKGEEKTEEFENQ